MSAFAMISGVLHRAPESRVSKNGKQFVTASVRVKDGEGSQFWRVTVFSESAQTELLRLSAGDAVSAQGRLEASIWTPDDGREPRINLALTADVVMALKPQPKERRKPDPEPAPEPVRRAPPTREPGDLTRYSSAADRDLDDTIPW
jgi:single-stranded DNA-binding protein